MMIVGVIEIIAGVLVLTRTEIGAYKEHRHGHVIQGNDRFCILPGKLNR